MRPSEGTSPAVRGDLILCGRIVDGFPAGFRVWIGIAPSLTIFQFYARNCLDKLMETMNAEQRGNSSKKILPLVIITSIDFHLKTFSNMGVGYDHVFQTSNVKHANSCQKINGAR